MPSNRVASSCVPCRPMLSYAWLIMSFCMTSWLMGTPAILSASSSTRASRSAAGTASSTRPHSAAVRPSMVSPVSSMRLAFSAPSRYTHIAVVAGAEGAALAGDDDDMDVRIIVGLLDRQPDLAGHGRVDGVEPLRAVEREAGLPAVDLVADALQGGVGHLLVTVTRATKAPSLLSTPTSLIPRKSRPAVFALKWSERPTANGEPAGPTRPISPLWSTLGTTLKTRSSGWLGTPFGLAARLRLAVFGNTVPDAVMETSSPCFNTTPVSVNACVPLILTVRGPILVVGVPVLRVTRNAKTAPTTTMAATMPMTRPVRLGGRAAEGTAGAG